MSRSSKLTWAASGFFALALHAAALAFTLSSPVSSEPDDEIGAPAMEVGIELATSTRDESDLPPGPESEASAASAAAVEQKAEPQETVKVQDTPVETDDPVQTVTPKEVPERKEVVEETKTQQSAASESVASEATAPPMLETERQKAVSTAPVQGTGRSDARLKATWQRRLVAHFDRHKKYPSTGARQNAEVLLGFTLDRAGHVLSVAVVKSSGRSEFDDAAVTMLKRSDPVPAPPPSVADEGLAFTVPVNFNSKG